MNEMRTVLGSYPPEMTTYFGGGMYEYLLEKRAMQLDVSSEDAGVPAVKNQRPTRGSKIVEFFRTAKKNLLSSENWEPVEGEEESLRLSYRIDIDPLLDSFHHHDFCDDWEIWG